VKIVQVIEFILKNFAHLALPDFACR